MNNGSGIAIARGTLALTISKTICFCFLHVRLSRLFVEMGIHWESLCLITAVYLMRHYMYYASCIYARYLRQVHRYLQVRSPHSHHCQSRGVGCWM